MKNIYPSESKSTLSNTSSFPPRVALYIFIPFLSAMNPIKEAGGKIGCPADAVKKVKDLADFISTKNGGEGAVREFIEWIVFSD